MGLKDSFVMVQMMVNEYIQIASVGAGEADGTDCRAGRRGAETRVEHAVPETGKQDLR
jgi:hypothetical protein